MTGHELGIKVVATTAAPPEWLVLTTALIAVLPSMVAFGSVHRGRWLIGLNAFGTLVHEVGHAAAAVLTGGGVYLVNVDSPDSGVTYWWYRSWLSGVLTSAAGYAAPPLAGLGVAALLVRGRVGGVLGLTVFAMIILLVVARGLLTIVTVLIVGALAFCALWWGSLIIQQGVAYGLAWLLLVHEVNGLRLLTLSCWFGEDELDEGLNDAEELTELTFIPRLVWIVLWAALVGWALWTALPMLWP